METWQKVQDEKKRRVAGYARVSTDSDEQFTSYEAQVDYYTNYIKSRDDWEFVSVYTDEGITGTSTKHREGFKRMVADALAGKIDLIVTKSVSRFARNTVDSLTTIRRLKEHGTECYFEKENIWTFDSKGELLITIMSSLAQEEARSISENCTWGQRKRMADGKVSVPFGRFLGYDRGEDGNLVVNEKDAATVRKIYSLFLQGMTPYGIAVRLTEEGIPSPGGKPQWNAGTVQRELERRGKGRNRHSGVHVFSGKVKCGECGGWYGSKVWHSTDKYRQTVWQCNRKFDGERKCHTPHFTDEELQSFFISAVNKLLSQKNGVLSAFSDIADEVLDTSALETEQEELETELNVTSELMNQCIYENAHIALDQTEYQKRFNALSEHFDSVKVKLELVTAQIDDKIMRKATIADFLKELQSLNGPVIEFEPERFSRLIDYYTVYGKDDVRVTFKNGTEIKA